jgi:hypothetical protein
MKKFLISLVGGLLLTGISTQGLTLTSNFESQFLWDFTVDWGEVPFEPTFGAWASFDDGGGEGLDYFHNAFYQDEGDSVTIELYIHDLIAFDPPEWMWFGGTMIKISFPSSLDRSYSQAAIEIDSGLPTHAFPVQGNPFAARFFSGQRVPEGGISSAVLAAIIVGLNWLSWYQHRKPNGARCRS